MEVNQATNNLQDQQAMAHNQPPKDNSVVTASLYFGDLAPTVAESSIYDLLQQNDYNVASVKVCRDKITRASLG